MTARSILTNAILSRLAQSLADDIADHNLTERELHFIAADLAEEAIALAKKDRADLKEWRNRKVMA